jgi:group I intron endonuclease
MIGRIYKIVNDLNDKVYVGQTIRTLTVRFQKHCSKSDDLGQTMAIKKAILKYGKEHFKIELIEECDSSILNEREIYWINFYNSYKKGYNLTKGGQGNGHSQKLSDDDELKLIDLYKEGYGTLRIAKLFNVDKTTVLNYVKKHNLKKRSSLEGMVDIEAVKAYIRENKPLVNDVAEKFGISRCSVYNIIKKANDETLIVESYNPRKSNANIHAEEICNMYNKGYNIQDLVKRFHTQKKYISKILKSNGIKIQRNRKALT